MYIHTYIPLHTCLYVNVNHLCMYFVYKMDKHERKINKKKQKEIQFSTTNKTYKNNNTNKHKNSHTHTHSPTTLTTKQ